MLKRITRRLSGMLLRSCERLYLYAHGWRSLPSPDWHGRYEPPADYPFERRSEYVRVHAVNAQRQVYAKATIARKEAERAEGN